MSPLEKNLSKELKKCRVCGNAKLTRYLDLGHTPLANSFITKNDLERQEDKFPLRVVLCEECYLSQLDVVVNPEVLFKNYVYRSSISKSFQEHCRNLAEELNNCGLVNKNSLIVDIASNDGTLLKQFKERNKVLGVEPATNIGKIANESGIKTVEEFWNENTAKRILKEYGKAKVITAFNVFAHVDDIHSFVKGIKILLDKDGYFIMECPHLLKLIEKVEFDTIYHEHLSYFLAKPLQKIMELHNMRVAKIEEFEMHGGSIRVYVEHKERSDRSNNSMQNVIFKEERAGLYNKKIYLDFSEKVKKIKETLVNIISNLKKEGKVIAGFGASAKGNTLLNYSNINNHLIDYILDATPEKQEKWTPGMHIPVIHSNQLMERKPHYLLLLAWNFAIEIMDKTKPYKNQGGKYIIPVPKVSVI